MRLLKFRAWHEEHGWADKVIIDNGRVEIVWLDRNYKSETWPEGQRYSVYDADNKGWVVEQFVGNSPAGQEIYEGDVLGLESINQDKYNRPHLKKRNVVGVVKFQNYGFDFVGDIVAPLIHTGKFLLMGNIHEHPYLVADIS